MKFAITLFVSSLGLLAATEPLSSTSMLTDANGIERLTISGLLLVAVVFLYRELKTERVKGEAREQALQSFIQTQTELITRATESQSAALGEVAQALGTQQAALEQQLTIFRDHINAILQHATHTEDKQPPPKR